MNITFEVNVPKSAGSPERLVTVTHSSKTSVLALKETLVALAGDPAPPAQLDLTLARTYMDFRDDSLTLEEAGVREGDRLRMHWVGGPREACGACVDLDTPVTIYVSRFDKVTPLEVTLGTTVFECKKLYLRKEGVVPMYQELFFALRVLEDDDATLASFRVTHGSRLLLHVRGLRGGGAAPRKFDFSSMNANDAVAGKSKPMSKATPTWAGYGVGVALTLMCATPTCPANDLVYRGLPLVLNCGMGVTDVGTLSEKPLTCPACHSPESATLTKQVKARECVLAILGTTAAAAEDASAAAPLQTVGVHRVDGDSILHFKAGADPCAGPDTSTTPSTVTWCRLLLVALPKSCDVSTLTPPQDILKLTGS